LLGNGDTNYINHAQIWYLWEMPSSATRPPSVLYPPYLPIGHDVCNTCTHT